MYEMFMFIQCCCWLCRLIANMHWAFLLLLFFRSQFWLPAQNVERSDFGVFFSLVSSVLKFTSNLIIIGLRSRIWFFFFYLLLALFIFLSQIDFEFLCVFFSYLLSVSCAFVVIICLSVFMNVCTYVREYIVGLFLVHDRASSNR